LKTNPFTCAIALRTRAPDESPGAWLVATVDGAVRHATDAEMTTWADLLRGFSEYDPNPTDYLW
jgi:hypothetical protein